MIAALLALALDWGATDGAAADVPQAATTIDMARAPPASSWRGPNRGLVMAPPIASWPNVY
jgi:hypothetical protein